jgi:hemerythrin
MGYWKDSLLVGVTIIDDEHRKLVAAIDELMDACMKGKGRDTIEKTLMFLSEYTKKHFADEEKLQAEYAYPGMAAHKKMHTQFYANITALINDFNQNGPNVALTGKINKTLVDWLIHHINAEDKKLGLHIQSKTRG